MLIDAPSFCITYLLQVLGIPVCVGPGGPTGTVGVGVGVGVELVEPGAGALTQ